MRWLPPLRPAALSVVLAFTGARVGEMCQLRKEDVRREGNHWVVTITPEAGTVKGNAQRRSSSILR